MTKVATRLQQKIWAGCAALALAVAAFSSLHADDNNPKGEVKVGNIFQDCPKCPQMIVIPGGKFIMGSSINNGRKNQTPSHPVTIRGPLAISLYEITFDQWETCLDEGVCKRFPDDHKWGRGTRPVINISWNDAQEYTLWLSKKTGRSYRLLSESEWEFAARGGTNTSYWWGAKMKKKYANCRNCGTKWSGKMPAPVGSFKPNPWGIYDMHGNIWEWTIDCWSDNYIGAPKDQSPRIDGDCKRKAVRGGSWYYFPKVSTSASRDSYPAHLWSYNIGIRLGVSLY